MVRQTPGSIVRGDRNGGAAATPQADGEGIGDSDQWTGTQGSKQRGYDVLPARGGWSSRTIFPGQCED